MVKKSKAGIPVLIILTFAATLFIWWNSTVDGEGSGALSKSVAEFFCGICGGVSEESFENIHHFIRKAAHFTEFAVLGVLYALIKTKLDGKAFSSLIFFPISCTLFTAVTDEFIQSFTGRGSSVRDVMLDFSGALTGIVLTLLIMDVFLNKCSGKSRNM